MDTGVPERPANQISNTTGKNVTTATKNILETFYYLERKHWVAGNWKIPGRRKRASLFPALGDQLETIMFPLSCLQESVVRLVRGWAVERTK